MIMGIKWQAMVLAAACTLGLAACSSAPARMDESSYRIAPFSGSTDYTVKTILLEDERYPQSFTPEQADDVIYEYNPDELLDGVQYRLPVLFDKHFPGNRNLRDADSVRLYYAEIEVNHLRTMIRTATFDTPSHFGRYVAELEVTVTIRLPDSTTLVRKSYSDREEIRRLSYSGRSPSAEMDRRRLYTMVEELVAKMAEDAARAARSKDNRRL